MVSTIGGDRIAVTSLVSADQDAHVFEPKPSDVKIVSQAQLVFSNGLGFEGWIPRLVKASSYKGEFVIVTKGIRARKMEAEEPDAAKGHGKEITDPHAWQNPANAVIYTKAIV